MIDAETYNKDYAKAVEFGYNKALNDMIEIIKEMRETAQAMMWCDCEYACDRFLEQLNGGKK